MPASPADRFHLVVGSRHGGAVIVHLSGDLDAFTATTATGGLADVVAAAPTEIIVDLAEVGFLDSYGLRVLLDAEAGAVHRGCAFSLRNVSRSAHRVLELVSGGRRLLAAATASA